MAMAGRTLAIAIRDDESGSSPRRRPARGQRASRRRRAAVSYLVLAALPDGWLRFCTCRIWRSGIIYVQGQRVANVPEEQILDRLLEECLAFRGRVQGGEAKLGQKHVEIVPPDPIGALGSGWEKIAAGLAEQRPRPATLTVRGT